MAVRLKKSHIESIVARMRELVEEQEIGKCIASKQVASEMGVNKFTALKYYNEYLEDRRTQGDLISVINDLRDEVKDIRRNIHSPFHLTPATTPALELTSEVTTEVFLSDVHLHPEHKQGHDPAAWELAKQIISDIKPDIVFWGGDILDCLAPARYEKAPRLATPEAWEGEMQYALQEITGFIRRLPEKTRHIWLTGNHELRLPKSVLTNAPWLISRIKSVEDELGLRELNIQIVEDGYKIGKLAHFHGHDIAGSGRVNIAKNKFDRLNMNMIFGHHHRFSEWLPRDFDRSYRGAWANGCLQWLSTDYLTYPEWHLGFSVVEYTKSGMFDVQKVLIHKPSVWSGKAEAIFYGKHYKVDMQYGDEGCRRGLDMGCT